MFANANILNLIMKKIYLTIYGKNGSNDMRYVVLDLDENTGTLNLANEIKFYGKCNLIIESEDSIIASVKADNCNLLKIYDKESSLLISTKNMAYNYSYGQLKGRRLYLASFESGVDTVFDMYANISLSNNVHKLEGHEESGKSHFIHKLIDKRIVSIDNTFGQISIYTDDYLSINNIKRYPDIKIRLMSFSPDEKIAYINTEATNEMLAVNTNDFDLLSKLKMSDSNGASAGNVITNDGKYLYSTIREANEIVVIKTDNKGNMEIVNRISCGKMPRDLYISDNYLLVSCTDENSVEVYKMNDKDLIKVNELYLDRPCVFGMH